MISALDLDSPALPEPVPDIIDRVDRDDEEDRERGERVFARMPRRGRAE